MKSKRDASRVSATGSNRKAWNRNEKSLLEEGVERIKPLDLGDKTDKETDDVI